MPNLLHKNRHDNVMNDQPGAFNEPGVGQPLAGQQHLQQGYDNNQGGQPLAGTGTGYGSGPHNDGTATGVGTGAGVGTGTGLMHHHNQQQAIPPTNVAAVDQTHNGPFSHSGQPGVAGTGAALGTGTGTGTGAGLGHHTGTHTGIGTNPNPNATGTINHNTNTHAGTHNQNTEPLHSSQVTTSTGKSPSSQARLGKIEHVAGTILHSSTLKAKGDAKIAEAEAVAGQQAELRQAEAMETHAQLARERANVHAARGNVYGSTHDAVGTHGAAGVPPGQGFR